MTLTLKHFDTRTGEWITIPNSNLQNRQDNPNIILTEKLENTLLEAFLNKEFPSQDYSYALSIGKVDEASSPENLYPDYHPKGDVLLLSNGKRLLYGPAEIKEQLIKKLNPDTMHNGAYGSLFTGECKNNYQGSVTFLVVNDRNGDNGGYIDDQQAWKLVGDCHGKINPSFSQELSNTTSEVIQFRLGNLTDGLYGKGTLAPKNFSDYFKDEEIGQKVAFIIPTSSFKGAGKGTVKPGLYTKEIWLGEKEKAQRGAIALSQLLASYPQALKDFIPELKLHLDKLKETTKDPRLLAQSYCEQYEKREKTKQEHWQPPTPSEAIERYRNYQQKTFNNGEDNDQIEDDSRYEEFLYLALKADPYHHRLLASKKFTQSLQDFVRKNYLDAAVGKLFKFDRAMIIPSKDLKTGEICVPWMKEGEQVLNFRAPFLNHNGMIHSTNKYVEDMYAPSGKELQGVIIVNDEDYSRIVNRTITEAKAINSNIKIPDIPEKLNKLSVDERITFTDQLNETFEQAGVDLRIPYESDCERMAADFDGDCMGVAEATRYPNFTKEVINKSQPKNLFKPTRKEDKRSFPEGTDFETIAIHQSDGISVGSINNSVTTFEALLSEQEIYETYGTPTLKKELAQQLIAKAHHLFKQEKTAKKPIPIPDFLRPNLEKIASFDHHQSLNQDQIQEVFDTQRDIYRKMVEEGCYQNQIAVDLFKSAREPDKDAITNLTKLLYRKVDYFKKKKDFQTYRKGILETKGFSPTELTASLVNVEFQENQLTSLPPLQFKNLFPSNYTPQQTLEVKPIKANYDAAYNLASAYNRKQKLEDDVHLKVTTKNGKTIEIVNYKRFLNHSEVNHLSRQPLNLRIIDNTNPKTKHNHQLITQYLGDDGQWKNLGFLCELSRTKHGLKAGLQSRSTQIKIAQSLGKKEVQLLFNQANSIALDWRKQLEATKTPDELNQYANATWHLCHNHSLDTTNNFVYSAFGDKIIEQTAQSELQFNNFLVGQLKKYNQVPESLWKSDQFLDLQIQEIDGEKMWQIFNEETQDYQSFGVASHKEYQLPIGTKVKGQIKGDLFTTARLDIDNPLLKDTEIVIGNMTKYPTVGHEFRNESATIILSEQQNAPPQPLIKVNGKKLGQLDSNAVELFKQHHRFRDQLTFNVSLTSYGEGNGKEIIATTDQGNSFKIEKSHFLADKDLKSTQFNGEQVTLTLSLETPKKKAMVANIRQEDGSLLPIGEFTTNQKASKLALSKVGLFKEGATFQAKINSRVTAASISIQPDSIEYPALGEWQKTSENATEIELEPTAKRFIETITTQPTLLHRFDQQWQHQGQIETLPTLGLSVDLNRVAATQEFLEKYHIPYKLIPLDDKGVQLETERSYGVFTMIEADVPPNIRQWMEQASKGVFDGNISLDNSMSPYHQRLISILPLSKNQQQERLQNSKAVYHTIETTKVDKRGSPPSENGKHNQTENSVKITANLDDKQRDKTSNYLSFNDLPSEPEIDEIDRLMEQQLKTDFVAPIAAQFLKVQDQRNSPTRHYQGKDITIDYDGHHLIIKNNQDDSIKMKARFVGVNPATKKSQWLSELPENAPGLRDADVQKWTSEAVKNYIEQKQNQQDTKQTSSMVKSIS